MPAALSLGALAERQEKPGSVTEGLFFGETLPATDICLSLLHLGVPPHAGALCGRVRIAPSAPLRLLPPGLGTWDAGVTTRSCAPVVEGIPQREQGGSRSLCKRESQPSSGTPLGRPALSLPALPGCASLMKV